MIIRSLKTFIITAILLFATLTISCSGRSGKTTVTNKAEVSGTDAAMPARLIKMLSPEEDAEFKLHSPVKIVLKAENKNQEPDSVVISFDSKRITVIRSEPWEYTVPALFTVSTGRKSLKVSAFKNGKAGTIITRFMIIKSDVVPVRYHYKTVNSFPHDRDAFTQGLFYDNGVLYEGTGQEAGSTLREVELKTGKVLRQLNLSSNLFGEGITLYKDRIYQVTWRSKIGFVYEKSTFKQINKIYYQSEGWGLTTIKDQIVMSDGTNALYFFEPEMFTVVSRLEVYDNEKKVDQLNELEYINGEIWANIWMTDLIARIDPVSGKVLGYIDLKGILKDPDTDTSVKVLNGIAFDKSGNRIFITGKNWPKLFEIRVTE